MTGLVGTFSDIGGFWYNLVFGLMIVAFTYFYTAVIINPNQMAEDMKRNGGYVPGVKPGKKTAEYIDAVMSRITFPGSVFLALVAIMPSIAMKFNVDNQFAQVLRRNFIAYFGGRNDGYSSTDRKLFIDAPLRRT